MRSPDRDAKSPKSRKAYSKPVLKVYGAVRTLTRNVGTMGPISDGAGPKSKTS